MNKRDLRIDTPCGADWSAMPSSSPDEGKARLCDACDKKVHDVSQMSDREVRRALANGPACVRYLYDVHGNVIFGAPPPNAQIVPQSALLSKLAKNKWLAAAALGASAFVFEACGGNAGSYDTQGRGYGGGFDENDAGGGDDAQRNNDSDSDEERKPAHPVVDDGGVEDADTSG